MVHGSAKDSIHVWGSYPSGVDDDDDDADGDDDDDDDGDDDAMQADAGKTDV